MANRHRGEVEADIGAHNGGSLWRSARASLPALAQNLSGGFGELFGGVKTSGLTAFATGAWSRHRPTFRLDQADSELRAKRDPKRSCRLHADAMDDPALRPAAWVVLQTSACTSLHRTWKAFAARTPTSPDSSPRRLRADSVAFERVSAGTFLRTQVRRYQFHADTWRLCNRGPERLKQTLCYHCDALSGPMLPSWLNYQPDVSVLGGTASSGTSKAGTVGGGVGWMVLPKWSAARNNDDSGMTPIGTTFTGPCAGKTVHAGVKNHF